MSRHSSRPRPAASMICAVSPSAVPELKTHASRGAPCRYNHAVFFVYMVRCFDGTLYTGFARDPHARVGVHNSGKGAKYTRSRLPVSLVYVEECESLSAALKRERQLKPWSRAKKEALIAGDRRALKRA